MSTAAALRREDPIFHDALVSYGAEAAQRCAPGKQRRYAKAIGVSRSRASRHLAGDPHSPSTRFLELLASGDGTSAFPILTEGYAVAIQIEIRKLTEAELDEELRQLDEREHFEEADENLQTCRATANPTPEQLEAAAKANIREANTSLRRAAVLREKARRLRRQS